jgi:pimeloyl-ACP methyl ester carboxylesterase
MYFEHGIILTKNILYDYVQVDLLISFCSEMGLRSVVLVGHDDGGLLTLKTAEKLRTYGDQIKVP